jgi:hypothetical protein
MITLNDRLTNLGERAASLMPDAESDTVLDLIEIVRKCSKPVQRDMLHALGAVVGERNRDFINASEARGERVS